MKIFIIALCLLMSSSVVFGQLKQEEEPVFWFGPKVGVDLSRATIDEAQIKSQIKSNYQLGFFLQFGRKFYIQPEVYYVTQKEKHTNNSTVYHTINTAKIPVLLGMRIFNMKVISAHVMMGPSTSIFLKQSYSGNNGSALTDNDKLNFSLLGGAGVVVLGLITFDARYAVDLNNQTKAQFKQLSWDSGLNVTLGIKLR